ncbi:hypothetical protein BCR36DRAFT_408303 [Piromyces finnis]|uniref:Vacuolar protein sorting-associated protein 8 central domain-containing protein n=1 Tax=Piromyces finnis TaxID=1754191 RepID=A0A1Y1VLY2_9FUNG|nr:hypothetical protein BCR36DRAFT_408303 [Piromyces finnis]|eukprot:ORX59933.1 hypothetical protein BCR36DRAFT_408303 [Piromyces finnis]
MEKTDPIQVISCLETKFNKIIVPENELPKISSSKLKEKKSELEILKEQLLNFEKDNKISQSNSDNTTNYTFILTKIENIIEKIVLEIKLYEQFINKTENRLTLDEILKESNDLPEEYINDIQSLTSSKIQSFIDNNNIDVSQSVCSSLSSPTFKRNNLNSYYNVPPKSISRYRRNSESNPIVPSKSNFSNISIKVFGNQKENTMPPGPSDVFQWTKLRTISEQLYSKRIKDEIGMPTVFCIRKYIVFGMSNGAVLIYDLNQNLKVMFGFTSEGIDISPVTSIAISPDNAYVASGHQNGKITIWDIEQSTKIKEILPINNKSNNNKKMHQENSTITFIDFINPSEIISADNNGMIFYHLIQKILMIYYVNTTRLYGLKNGIEINQNFSPILSLSVLTKGNAKHPIEDTNIVAFSTTDAITVFSMKPEMNVQYCYKWNKNSVLDNENDFEPVTYSCLSWYPALKTEKVSNNSIKVNDPLLAYSYNNNLTIVRISKHRKYKNKFSFQFINVGNWKAKHNITLIRWLNSQYIVLMDNQENLIIFDVLLMNSIEKSDVCRKQILCQSINIDSSKLQSEAITYQHSVQSFKGRLCILCRTKFYIVSLFSWEERISALIRSGNIVEAISIAIDFYKNNSRHAVMNLPTDNERRMIDTGEYIEKLLVSYVNMTLVVPVDYEYINPEMSDKAVYQHLSHICFEVCITIGRFDLLYGHIYDKFSECHLQDIFFETLEIYILNHKIDKLYTEDNLNPSISEAFINYFYEKKWYSRLEECIILIDPQLLNIDNLIKIFRDKKLYKGLIYIYSHVLKDFISPIIDILMDLIEEKEINQSEKYDDLNQMMNVDTNNNFVKLKTRSENDIDYIKTNLKLQNSKDNLRSKSEGDVNKKSKEKSVKIIDTFINKDNEEEVTNIKKIYNKKKNDVEYMLYVFLAYSLSGKSFPFGLPNLDNAKEAKIQCYNFLFSKNYIKWQYKKEFKEIIIGISPYPYLKELFKRNTAEMLKVLGAAFEDASMNEEIILDPGYLKIDKDTSLINETNKFMNNNDIDYVDFDDADKSLKKVNYQYIIHILFDIIDNYDEFSNYEKLQFYEFICRMISKFSTFIYLEDNILEKIYNFLLDYKEDEYYIKFYNEKRISTDDLINSTLFVNSLGLTVWESRDIRQHSIQSILTIYNPPESKEKLIKKYRKAKYYKLCENIYIRKRNFSKIIECYLFDRYRQKDVYQCIFEILHLSTSYTSFSNNNSELDIIINSSNPDIINYSHLTTDQLNDIKNTITENVEDLLKIDCNRLAYVIILLFSPNSWLSIYQSLISNDLKYRFLKSILQLIFTLGPTIEITPSGNLAIEVLENKLINGSNNVINFQPKEVTFSSDIIEITPKVNKINNKKIKRNSKNEFTLVTENSSTNYKLIQELINRILCVLFYKKISTANLSETEEKKEGASKKYQITSPFLIFEQDINEVYIELICQCEPEQVMDYLKFIDETYKSYFYSTEKISEICRRYNVVDSSAWIMEKCGNINKALDCFLDYIQEQFDKINELIKKLDSSILNKDDIHYTVYGEIEEERLKPQIKTLFEIIEIQMKKAIDLCRRSESIYQDDKVTTDMRKGAKKSFNSKDLWYKLFITFVKPYCEFKKYVIDETSPIIKEIKKMESTLREKSNKKTLRFSKKAKENQIQFCDKEKFFENKNDENSIINDNTNEINTEVIDTNIKRESEGSVNNESNILITSEMCDDKDNDDINNKNKVNKNIIIDIWKDINLSNTLQFYIKTILNSMIGFISFPKLVVKLISEDKKDYSKYGEYKEIILLVIEMYNFEYNLLQSVNKITMEDIAQNTYFLNQDLHKAIRMDCRHCHLCHKKLITSLTSPSSISSNTSISSLSPISSKSPEAKDSFNSGCEDNDTVSKEKQAYHQFMAKGIIIKQDDSVVYFFCGHLFHKCCIYDYIINHPNFFSKLYSKYQKQYNEENKNSNNVSFTSFTSYDQEICHSQSSRGSFNYSSLGVYEKSSFWLKICPICDNDDSSQKSIYPQIIKRKTKTISYKKVEPYLPLSIPYNGLPERIQGTTSPTSPSMTLEEQFHKQTKGKLGTLPKHINKEKLNEDLSDKSTKASFTNNSKPRPPPLQIKTPKKKALTTNNKEQQITSLDQFEQLTNSVSKYEILSEIEYYQINGNQNSNHSEVGSNSERINKIRNKTLPSTFKSMDYQENNDYNRKEGAILGDEASSSKLVQSPTKTSFISNESGSITPTLITKMKSTPIFYSNHLSNSKKTPHSNSSISPTQQRLTTHPNYIFSLLDTNKKNDTYKLKLAPPTTPPSTNFILPSTHHTSQIPISQDQLTSPISKVSSISTTSPISAVLLSSPTANVSSLIYSDDTSQCLPEDELIFSKKNKGKEPI